MRCVEANAGATKRHMFWSHPNPCENIIGCPSGLPVIVTAFLCVVFISWSPYGSGAPGTPPAAPAAPPRHRCRRNVRRSAPARQEIRGYGGAAPTSGGGAPVGGGGGGKG